MPEGKPPKKGRRIIITRKPNNPKRSVFSQGFIAILVFLFLIVSYSSISNQPKLEEISLSELAQNIADETILSISIKGDELLVVYKDGLEKISKKEEGTALSTTLKNYDVSPESLSGVIIEVKNDQGFLFWFASLA